MGHDGSFLEGRVEDPAGQPVSGAHQPSGTRMMVWAHNGHVITECFDALLYVDRTTRARPNPPFPAAP